MKCFKCGAEAPAGNKFCPHCGASMSVGAGQPAAGAVQNQVNPGQGAQNMQMQNPGYPNMQMQNPGYPNMQMQNPGYQNPGFPIPRPGGDSLATPAMILGIVADLLCLVAVIVGNSAEYTVLGHGTSYYDKSTMTMATMLLVIGVICALIGFILAICSLTKKTTKRGRAIAGLVCNGIIAIPLILGILFVLLMMGS